MHVHWVLCFSLLSLHPASAYHVTRQSSSRSSNRLLSRTALRPGYYSNSCTRELNRLSTALPALKVPLIQPTGANWWIWSLLAGASSLGIVLENTKIGAMLSSPLVTMGISLILCNIGILPTSSPVYSTVLKIFVPLAIPLLLLDADLKKCFNSTGTLLKAFLIGSIGTFIGTMIAYALVNFVAVSDILQTAPELVAAAMAADNVVVAVYFAFLFSLCRPSSEEELLAMKPKVVEDGKTLQSRVTLETLSLAVTLGFFFCAVSQTLGSYLSISPMLLVSVLAVLAATLFPRTVGTVSASGGVIGVLIMQMFFAVTGAMGHIPTVIRLAPSLFLHTLIQISVHFIFTLGVGKFFKLPLREIVLASNANVGGPTTAAAMANSKQWKELVLPALLTGIFGYAVATGLGLLAARVLPLIPCL